MKETPVNFSAQLWHKVCFFQLIVSLCPLQFTYLIGSLGSQSHAVGYGLFWRTVLEMLWVIKKCCSSVAIWRKYIHILQFLG